MRKKRGTSPSRFPPTQRPIPVEPVKVVTDVRVLTKAEVLEKVGGVCWITLRSWIKAGGFPAARQLGPGQGRSHTGWLSSEIDEWLLNSPKRLPKGGEAVSRIEQDRAAIIAGAVVIIALALAVVMVVFVG